MKHSRLFTAVLALGVTASLCTNVFADVFAVETTEGVEAKFNFTNAGVEILPADGDKITADYSDEYFTVNIIVIKDSWTVEVKAKPNIRNTGIKNTYDDHVKLYLPEAEFSSVEYELTNAAADGVVLNGNMTLDITNSALSASLPDGFTGTVSIEQENSGLEIVNEDPDGYGNIDVQISGENSVADVPGDFETKMSLMGGWEGFSSEYHNKNKEAANKLFIDMVNSGASIN